ncbi:MAG: pyridoxal-dependent decarboxylase [Gemmatimonadota bacterium]
MPPDELRVHGRAALEWVAQYLETIRDTPVFDTPEPGFLAEALPGAAPEHGEEMGVILADFERLVVPGLTHWNHPGFYGYFANSASGPGILGELLASAVNVNSMVWKSSPAATELEDVTTRWLARMLGLPDTFEGVINDTASSSTMYALAAARETTFPEAHEKGLFGLPPGRVYASEEAHSSVEKAVLALGLGQEGMVRIPVDGARRMDPTGLRRAIATDLEAGRRPMAVVPTLGTTGVAAIDPVAAVIEVAREFGVWVHVDAAYGGPAALVPEVAEDFAGWEGGDSIVVNPHKWLFTPMDCSVLYSRRPEVLARAFSIVPEYLTTEQGAHTRSLMDYGIALGRRLRSLKLWFVMRYFGRAGLEGLIEEHLRLARLFASLVEESASWSMASPLELALVVFRHDAGDAVTRAAMDRVNETGRAFLTHTVVDDRVVIRLSIGNIRTTEADVREVWSLLNQAADAER